MISCRAGGRPRPRRFMLRSRRSSLLTSSSGQSVPSVVRLSCPRRWNLCRRPVLVLRDRWRRARPNRGLLRCSEGGQRSPPGRGSGSAGSSVDRDRRRRPLYGHARLLHALPSGALVVVVERHRIVRRDGPSLGAFHRRGSWRPGQLVDRVGLGGASVPWLGHGSASRTPSAGNRELVAWRVAWQPDGELQGSSRIVIITVDRFREGMERGWGVLMPCPETGDRWPPPSLVFWPVLFAFGCLW